MSVFVNDAFTRELKTPPFFWIGSGVDEKGPGRELSTPLGQAAAGSERCGGLNLVVWEGCIRAEDSARPELYSALIVAFLQEHRGFLLKEVIAAQAESAERLAGMLNTGGMLLHPGQRRWSTHLEAHPEQIVSSPT